MLDALPNFLGGKRELAPLIFRRIADAGVAPGATLADPFFGGGSISLLGKALGYRVLGNDVSPRSEAIGKALVENSHTTLADEDVAYALTKQANGWYLPPVEQLALPDEVRSMLAGIAAAAEDYDGYARWMMRALCVKATLRISMWGQPRMTVGHKVRERRWGDLTVGQARAIGPMVRPRKAAQQAARSLPGGVFSNGERNEMHRGDVLDFLAGPAERADVVYLDPPYPGTVSYEASYNGLDALLDNRAVDDEPSRFSAKEGWRFLREVFEACEHIPVWVLSLGNEAVDLETLKRLMEETGRTVNAEALEYSHLHAQASDAKREANEEFLLVAHRPQS